MYSHAKYRQRNLNKKKKRYKNNDRKEIRYSIKNDEDDDMHIIPLSYHYENDNGSWKLMGTDLKHKKFAILLRMKAILFLVLCFDFIVLAWPIASIYIWGFKNSFLSIVFFVYIFKVILLVLSIFSTINVYKMYGRQRYSYFWGIWTRCSHVRSNIYIYTYGWFFGWMCIPMILMYITSSILLHFLGFDDTIWWMQVLIGLLILFVGYISWCLLISEYAIRNNIEQYVAMSPNERKQ